MIKKNLFSYAILAYVLVFVSCQKEELLISPDILGTNQETSSTSNLKAATVNGFTEYVVNPKFGKPSSTNYYFQVYDPTGTLALSVKLYEKTSGTTTYLPMTRTGGNWILSTKITINGWYDYRYVYSATKANISSNPAYTLCNTRNTFSVNSTSTVMTSPCYLTWPFGADGSSWFNRTVTVNGISQSWAGGEEGGYGYGWNEGTHIGTTERFADDWNRGTGSQDLGAELRSPLDGIVIDYGTYNTDLGASKFVSIKQEGSNGKIYKFFFGHMNQIDPGIVFNKYVRAGVTRLGTLGATGASSPHAHCSLRDITNENNQLSAQFGFSAQ